MSSESNRSFAEDLPMFHHPASLPILMNGYKNDTVRLGIIKRIANVLAQIRTKCPEISTTINLV
jgi:hypothetical protein